MPVNKLQTCQVFLCSLLLIVSSPKDTLYNIQRKSLFASWLAFFFSENGEHKFVLSTIRKIFTVHCKIKRERKREREEQGKKRFKRFERFRAQIERYDTYARRHSFILWNSKHFGNFGKLVCEYACVRVCIYIGSHSLHPFVTKLRYSFQPKNGEGK